MSVPGKAMVLAAGLGKRMRPLTETMPKPLVPVGGKPLIDWGLDALDAAGVRDAVVNVHYLAEQLTAHLAARTRPRITISDERERLLDSGGGIVKALPMLGPDPFFVLNADTFWVDHGRADSVSGSLHVDDESLKRTPPSIPPLKGEGGRSSTPSSPSPLRGGVRGGGPGEAGKKDSYAGLSNLERLGLAWDAGAMDILLLLADPASATGHMGSVDFSMEEDGRLTRADDSGKGYIYAGAAIVHPRVFDGAPAEPHSLNRHFDRAIAAGRLFGMPLDGHWITVGTPDAIAPAEAALKRLGVTS